MNLFGRMRDKKSEKDSMREKWLCELQEVKNELDANDMLFNMTDDFNLADYAIHKKTALEARYSYLIRLIRKYDEVCLDKTDFNIDGQASNAFIPENESLNEQVYQRIQRL